MGIAWLAIITTALAVTGLFLRFRRGLPVAEEPAPTGVWLIAF